MKKFISFGLAIFVLSSSNAFSSTGEIYGYGSRAGALGNTSLGGSADGYATFYNPAANSTHPGFTASLGFGYAHPSFRDIKSVTIDNSVTSSATGDVVGDVNTSDYLDHLGQMVGLSYNIGENWKNLTIGVAAFMPLERVAYIDSGDPYRPEYFSYRSRTQRPQIYAAMSATAWRWIHLGTGLYFATNMSASTTVFAAGSTGKVSSQRFATTMKPTVAPYFSIYLDPKPFESVLTIRLPNTYKVSVDSTAKANFMGGTAEIPVIINSSSSIFYDPFEVDFALAYLFPTDTYATVELDWLQYKVFETPIMTVVDRGGSRVNNSITTTPEMQNIFVPKVALQQNFSSWSLRAGYGYRPSPIKNAAGNGNLVDPAKHMFTFGAGIDLKKAGLTQSAIQIDFHGQYHSMVAERVTKTAGNEAGTSGQTKVGSPGYDIGGSIYGGGMSITVGL